MLIICPTPIGNLNDLSIRQYEALKNSDIIACEDTRRTSKLLNLIKDKKVKDNFFREFRVSFEDFIDKGGLSMEYEDIKKTFILDPEYTKNKEKNDTAADIHYSTFYEKTIDKKQDEHDSGKFNENPKAREQIKEFNKTETEGQNQDETAGQNRENPTTTATEKLKKF